MVPAVCRKGFISCLSPVKRVLQRLAEHGAQQIAAVNLDGEDRDVKLTLDVFERDIVQKDALAVAQHGLRNEQAAAEDFPPELTAKAGSLYPGGPAPVSRAALAGAIGRELLALCPGFACLDEYRARCFVPGHWVTVCTGTETYAAQALSIDDVGRLVVQREGGRTEALRCGEVTIRPTKTE